MNSAPREDAQLVWWLLPMPDQEALSLWMHLLQEADAFLPNPQEDAVCASCAGDCCEAITYILPGGWRRGGNEHRDDITMPHMEKLALGAHFKWDMEITGHEPCVYHDPKIGCAQYEDRPPMCRGYYCYGEHWRAKEE